MKNQLLTLLLSTSLFACNQQAKETFMDNQKLLSTTDYTYFYEDGRLTKQLEKTTLYDGDVPLDSFTQPTHFSYNAKGAVVQESTLLARENLSFRKLYNYNAADSLVEQLSISPENDTLTWEQFDYFPDGRKRTFWRFLMDIAGADPTAASSASAFDTSYSRYEHTFDADKHIKTIEYNQLGIPIKTILYEHQGGKLIRASQYTMQNGLELLEKHTYYDYSKSLDLPDTYSITASNDTVEFVQHEFEAEELIKTSSLFDYGTVLQEEHFEKGLIKMLTVVNAYNPENNQVLLFEYYPNGDLKRSMVYNAAFLGK